MTRYPANRVYCRVPVETAPRVPFRLGYWQACALGFALGFAFVAAVIACG